MITAKNKHCKCDLKDRMGRYIWRNTGTEDWEEDKKGMHLYCYERIWNIASLSRGPKPCSLHQVTWFRPTLDNFMNQFQISLWPSLAFSQPTPIPENTSHQSGGWLYIRNTCLNQFSQRRLLISSTNLSRQYYTKFFFFFIFQTNIWLWY